VGGIQPTPTHGGSTVNHPLPVVSASRLAPPALVTEAPVLGVIVGTRDFFPSDLVAGARQKITEVCAGLGIEPILAQGGAHGGVETWADAKACADLLRRESERLAGIVVLLPNFGSERAIVDAVRLSGLRVPILVQAEPDDLAGLSPARRRDGFCGKISVCNNLRQYGYAFTLTKEHVSSVGSASFREDLARFARVCSVVRGLGRVRVGAIGARPAAFNTVRYSEKLLEKHGVSVVTLDLSELFGNARKLGDDHPSVRAKADEIRSYADASKVPANRLLDMAKLGAALDAFCVEEAIDVTAIQCWSSLQANYGVNACTLMSMLSHGMRPSACEVDVTGALSMYALELASGLPAALADWNNNYADSGDRCVLFHCGNWPKRYVADATVGTAPILGSTLGVDNTWGALHGRTPAGPCTFARLTTDDEQGAIRAYVAEGRFTNDALETFGCRAVAEVPALERLLGYICREGFEHHCAMTHSACASIVAEAFDSYLGWPCYHHQGDAR
jgi:L-fucose isomerase-like protein